jgi:tetratricopeptide (TPR) repeat protein
VNARNYSNRSKIAFKSIDRKQLPIGPISLRALQAGEAAIMSVRIQSDVGVDENQAATVAAEARRIAGQYPNEAAVLTALAKAEFDAENYDAAIAAADRALALDPNQIKAIIQKGYALRQRADAAGAPESAWKELRSHWIKANKIENDNPVPLVEFYQTYLRQGIAPTKNAIEGLEWAMTLAPFDSSIRWMAAQQMIQDERLADAVGTLIPLAYSPHPGEMTESARKLVADLEGRIAAAGAKP